MTVKLIIATSTDYGIGLDNKLPWHCPEDLQYFKKVTKKSTVIMGKNTWQSLPMYPSGLPCRQNIVLSSTINSQIVYTENISYDSLEFYPSYRASETSLYTHPWIIGGATIYKEMLPVVEEIHHTLIKGEYECDTFFDMSFLYNGEWQLESSKELSEIAVVNVWKRKEV